MSENLADVLIKESYFVGNNMKFGGTLMKFQKFISLTIFNSHFENNTGELLYIDKEISNLNRPDSIL